MNAADARRVRQVCVLVAAWGMASGCGGGAPSSAETPAAASPQAQATPAASASPAASEQSPAQQPGPADSSVPETAPAADPTPPAATAPAADPGAASVAALPSLRGVSLAGAEFAETSLPGTFQGNYTYPTTDEIDHFVALGMNVFRLPFRWERLQQQQLAAFDAAEQGRIDALVSYATAKGAYVLIDPHNYARYYGAVIGEGVPASAFADFWSKLATHFKDNPRVLFGLMNEPNTMSTELWLADANAAIAAIRATGATNLILVPGNAWTGAHSWLDASYGTPNAQVMLGIVDPLDNFAIEVHQYLDGNAAGTDMGTCVSSTVGSERLAAFTGWLAENGLRGFLGELGAGTSATCLAAIDDMLAYMDARPQQWLGWAYWAAGPWWGGSVGNIEPVNGQDVPQTAVLVQHVP